MASVVFFVTILLIVAVIGVLVQCSNRMAYGELCKHHGYDHVSGLFNEATCVKIISVPVSDLLERDE